MVVADVRALREDLTERGVEITEVEAMPRGSFAVFADPDGATRVLQQTSSRP